MLVQHRLASHDGIAFSPPTSKRSSPTKQFVDLKSGVAGPNIEAVGNEFWLNELGLGFIDYNIRRFQPCPASDQDVHAYSESEHSNCLSASA